MNKDEKYQAQLKASREWKKRNAEKLKAYQKLWRAENAEKVRRDKAQWDIDNREHRKEYAKQYKTKRPDYFVRKHLDYSYGITLEEYETMRESQRGRCAVCGKHEEETQRKRLFVDHSHSSGKIRGLLCQQCNTALGMVNEDTDILFALASYLEEHR